MRPITQPRHGFEITGRWIRVQLLYPSQMETFINQNHTKRLSIDGLPTQYV